MWRTPQHGLSGPNEVLYFLELSRFKEFLVNSCSILIGEEYTPEVLFLSETKSNHNDIRRIKDKLQFDKFICVEAHGRAGGLALFWIEDLGLRITNMDVHFIDCMVRRGDGKKWRMTGFYGWPESGQKFRTWEMINLLGLDNDTPWLVGGLFQ